MVDDLNTAELQIWFCQARGCDATCETEDELTTWIQVRTGPSPIPTLICPAHRGPIDAALTEVLGESS